MTPGPAVIPELNQVFIRHFALTITLQHFGFDDHNLFSNINHLNPG